MAEPTAALVVVGSEVLSAKVEDENGPWLARRLRDLGVRLTAIDTVPDRAEDIVEAVRRLGPRVDWLFTSGGLGPTHDDVTVKAVGDALGRRVSRLGPLAEAIRALHRKHHGGADPPEVALRMADVPDGTRLLGDPGYPTLAVENVVMLPGVPRFFRWQLEAIAPLLRAAPYRLANVFVDAGEEEIAPALEAVVAAHPDVEIGSYPRFDPTDHRVKVTVEAKDDAAVRAALAALVAALPAGRVVRVEGP
jgi:molybdenum cofactor synthesis domain-containing protein